MICKVQMTMAVAAMSLVQQGDDVLASLCLNPPAVVLLGPL